MTDDTRRLLFERVVKGVRIDPAGDPLFIPRNGVSYEGEPPGSDVLMRSPMNGVAHVGQVAVEAAEQLAALLHRELGLAHSSVQSDALVRVLRAAVAVRAGAAGSLGAALEQLVERLTTASDAGMIVFAIGGAKADTDVVPIGQRALFGHLTNDCAQAISELALRTVGRGIYISSAVDAFWVEDYVAQREDPYIAEEIAAESPFVTPVLAVCVPAIGITARFRGLQVAEAVLGALWVCSTPETWPTWPPWIIGLPTTSESPRNPDLDEASGGSILPLQVLQVDAAGSTSGDGFEWREGNLDVTEAMRAGKDALVGLVADASFSERTAVGPRLSSSCRLVIHAARELDPELVALHSAIALEGLVGNDDASSGTRKRFVSRLASLVGDAASERTPIVEPLAMRAVAGLGR